MDIKTKNTIKRIAAMSVGALMMGTTLMSAVAAAPYTLADFPAPFVAAGKGDFTIVVGQDAKPDDIIGAVDVGVGLQASGGRVPGQAAGVISGENVPIEEAGNPLNFEDGFADVLGAGLDDSDLPTILADGNFEDNEGTTDNEEGYTQEINWAVGTDPELVYDAEDDGNKVVGDYVRIANNNNFYEYVLDFDTDIDFVDDAADAADDMEDNMIEIQGWPYIITDFVYDDVNNDVEEIELLTGETIITLTQGDSYTFDGHTVIVTKVTDPEAADEQCGVSVDGETQFINAGDDEDFDGLRVGVSDIFAIHGAVGEDACEITLGSVLTKLVNAGEVEVNGEDIGDRDDDPDVTTAVVIDADLVNGGAWGGFTITVQSDDEVNLGSATDGEDWTDPVFGNFKMNYLGLSGETEDIKFEAETDDGKFTFTNNEGKTVEVPVFAADNDAGIADSDALYFGEDTDTVLIMESDETSDDTYALLANCQEATIEGSIFNNLDEATDDTFKNEDFYLIKGDGAPGVELDDLSGTLLFLASAGQTARVVEITEVDTGNDWVSFKDLTYGRTIDSVEPGDGDVDDVAGEADTYDLSGIGIITLEFRETADCDGTFDTASVELTNGNLADVANQDLDLSIADAVLLVDGYETDGQTIITLDEDLDSGIAAADPDGDDEIQIGVLESSDISDADRTAVNVAMWRSDSDEDDEVLIDAPVDNDAGAAKILDEDFVTTGAFADADDDNDNDRYAMTLAGSLWHVNENDDGNIKDVDAKVAFGEAMYGSAFVAETGALFTAPTTATEATPAATTAFTGTLARLDTEITDKTAVNMLLIGGPCVNRLTAELLGKTYPACGIEVATELSVPLDGAQIALYENAFSGTKVAMTVMGTDAAGTRAASEVLKRYAEFRAQLTGMKVNVKSTAGVITVSAPVVTA